MSDDAKNYDESLTILVGLMKVNESVSEMKIIVQELIDDAIAAEREECSKIAHEASAWCRSFSSEETADQIEAAIRSRGEKT
tara:strand:+ start:908 stop:1153 length:246 start_codon:yes stop_codon:yes gene_type:complete